MEDFRCATELEVTAATYNEVHFLECQKLLHLHQLGFRTDCLYLSIALTRLSSLSFALLISTVTDWLPILQLDLLRQQPTASL